MTQDKYIPKVLTKQKRKKENYGLMEEGFLPKLKRCSGLINCTLCSFQRASTFIPNATVSLHLQLINKTPLASICQHFHTINSTVFSLDIDYFLWAWVLFSLVLQACIKFCFYTFQSFHFLIAALYNVSL